jgi:hypothetical protein
MTRRTWFVLGAVVLATLARCIPHPPNVAPITAIALFGAATLADRRFAWITPLAALFASDLAMEGLYRLGLSPLWGFYPGMWGQYAAILAIASLGFLLRRHKSVPCLAAVTLVSSCLFFVITNFAVWTSTGMYPRTSEGLAECFIAAYPFFRNTVLGDMIYVSALFGAFALAKRRVAALEESPSMATTERS